MLLELFIVRCPSLSHRRITVLFIRLFIFCYMLFYVGHGFLFNVFRYKV